MNKKIIVTVGLAVVGAVAGWMLVQKHQALLYSLDNIQNYVERRRLLQEATPTPVHVDMTLRDSSESADVQNLPGRKITVAIDPPQRTSQDSGDPWGVAQKVDEGTYTIKVGEDEFMATPQEVLAALNHYRAVNGSSGLQWDQKLADYAQSRAQTFQGMGTTDKHAGFNAYLEGDGGFEALGYGRLGENSYYGGKLSGTHLIEWVFSQSPGHNKNQLDPQWTDVGIGVTNNAVNLNFGGNKF